MVSFGSSHSSNNPSTVWRGQAPYLQALYANMQNLAAQQVGGNWIPYQGSGGNVTGGKHGGNTGVMPYVPPGGGGNPTTQPVGGGQAYAQQGGQMPGGGIGGYSAGLVNSLVGGTSNYMVNNPYLSAQIQGLGADMGNFYQNQILPGIASSAGLNGQFGGSRQSVAAGMAGQDLARQFQQGATTLRSNAYDSGMQNMMGLYNLGMQPYQAQWAPFAQYANLLGAPTVLGGGGSSGGSNFGILNFGGSSTSSSSGKTS